MWYNTIRKGDFMKNFIERFKSPVVIGGLISIVITISGINPNNMTSWEILFENLIGILQNPFILISIIYQIFAFLNNPTDRENF